MKHIAMSMSDRIFLSSDTDVVRTHMLGVPLLRIPGNAAEFVDDLVARFPTTTVTAPFNRVPTRWPRRHWEVIDADAVDFSHHVVRTTLPPPGSMRDLEAAIARIHSRPLDRAKPLWELHVIDGLADGRIALCMKVHHALMDAMRLIKLMSRTFSSDADDGELRPIWCLPPRSSSATGGRPRLGVARKLSVVRELVAGAWRFLAEAWRPTDPAFAVPLRCPRSRRLNGRLSRHRSWAGNRVRRRTSTRVSAPRRSITQRALPGGAVNSAARVPHRTRRIAAPQSHCRRARVEPGTNCRPLARCGWNDPSEPLHRPR
jgi:diacylglycerol O-acyltransferase